MPPRFLPIVALTLFAIPARAIARDRDGLEFFESKIRPVLVEHCFKCHTGAKAKADLRLDTRAAMLKGSDNGPAIIPGVPGQGLLMKAIRYGDSDVRMPPRGKLPEPIIADFAEWIRRGAPWPEEKKNPQIAKANDFDLAARARHWSLQPLAAPALPSVKQAAWPTAPIDYFILSKLEERGLAPAPPADRRTLIRRVTFDLIGLPPTKAEIDAFLGDESPEAFVKVVDRLLSSPRYGERWARHWLDLVRFAETHGHEFDFPIPEAWRYRDYVIRALDADVAYDRFVTEHIAGDLLAEPRRHPVEHGNESVLGTGFWWLGEAKHSPVDSRADQADRVDNQIDVFGKTFLGLTLACARCHDHKFDAVSTKDYYALAGYLQSSREDLTFLDEPAERAPRLERLREIVGKIKAILPAANAPKPALVAGPYTVFADFSREAWARWFTTGEAFGNGPSRAGDVMLRAGPQPIRALVPPGIAHSGILSTTLQGTLRSPTFTITQKQIHYLIAGKQARVRLVLNGLQLIQEPIYGRLAFSVDNDALEWRSQNVSMWIGQRAFIEILDDGRGYAALAAVLFSDDGPPALSAAPPAAPPALDGETQKKLQTLAAEFHQVEASLPPPRRGLATADGSAVDEHVFIRGNSGKLGPIVPRRFLEVFGGDRIAAPGNGSGRLELARQLTDPARTPIVPRVMVNRLWQHHFVEGIVRSPDDFGALGQAPTHPELLDYLATTFVRAGWSLKKMHRLMLLSSAYRMGSRADARTDEADPDNKLLHKMPIRRLEAEAIRDAVLAVSGRLDSRAFGAGVMPHLTPFLVGRGRPGISGPLDGDGRRSIYLNVRRNFLNPMFLAFDYPTPFSTRGRRSVSNVPAQALTMMNNPLVLQQAERWAKRIIASGPLTVRQRLDRMYEEALGRLPSDAEAADAVAFVQTQGDELEAWTNLAHVLFNVKEFIFIN
jgi:Protein of unknown function (DUF1553)/Protein of unknown function (DUF1549)/Planctomycete cytochrome C